MQAAMANLKSVGRADAIMLDEISEKVPAAPPHSSTPSIYPMFRANFEEPF